MKTLQQHIEENINESLLSWLISFFKKSIKNTILAKRRKLLPNSVEISEIKVSNKPLDNYKEFKKILSSTNGSFTLATKMLNEMTKRTIEGSNDKLDTSKCRFIEFIYIPKDAFDNEKYIAGIAGYVDGQEIVEGRSHILFFEGDKSVVSNWDNLSNDLFKTFVDQFIKNDKLSMWYISNTNELPQYNGKKFEAIEDSQNKVAILGD